HRSLAFLYGLDPGVACLCFASFAWWLLGYPEQAQQRVREALALARALFHPFSLALAFISAAWLHQFRREGRDTQEQAEAVMTLSTDQGFPLWWARGAMLRGWALVEQGRAEEGSALIQQGVAAYQATGADMWGAYRLVLLAEAYGEVGRAA